MHPYEKAIANSLNNIANKEVYFSISEIMAPSEKTAAEVVGELVSWACDPTNIMPITIARNCLEQFPVDWVSPKIKQTVFRFMVIPFPHHPTKLPKSPRICHSLHHRREEIFVVQFAKTSPIEPIAILGEVQVGMLFADAVIRAVDHTFHIRDDCVKLREIADLVGFKLMEVFVGERLFVRTCVVTFDF